jgi:hypothetical protein
MPLTNFFRINLPYGIKQAPDGSWTAFNREYSPLGYNQRDDLQIEPSTELPIYTRYKGNIEKIATKHNLYVSEGEEGKTIFFYDDETNPTNKGVRLKPKFKWDRYFKILQDFSKLEVK